MKKYRVSYYVENEAQIKGLEPHNNITECEMTEAENELDAIYNIAYWLREQAAENDDVNYIELNDDTAKVSLFNFDDKCFEHYYNFKAEEIE